MGKTQSTNSGSLSQQIAIAFNIGLDFDQDTATLLIGESANSGVEYDNIHTAGDIVKAFADYIEDYKLQ